ncbi:RNA-binding transcriptional accessory protein [filamentous cyanobacterium CCP2]|nr:RNA-binding transcriptional accessory protein [filamentous cyanobacterium CCP2]
MLNIPQLLATELSLKPFQVENALQLLAEGSTVPFISRYRKERTGEMNEVQLRELFDRYTYLTELEERKAAILKSIQEQGKLTEELRDQIETCLQKNELEDLYLPYRPKRRTRATIAKEKGLEPLAEWIKALNQPNAQAADLEPEAAKYVSAEKGVNSAEDALKGASDILAEEVAEQAALRAYLRDYLMESGIFASQVKADYPEGTTKFEMYRNYQAKVKAIAPHNLLALYRGETEGILDFALEFDEETVLGYLESEVIRTKQRPMREFYRNMIKDAFNRLMKNSLIGEVRTAKKLEADVASIGTFEANLRELLLSAPAGMKPTLAIDPGFRTGCKVVALDQTGKFLEYQTIFPHASSDAKRVQAGETLKRLLETYQIELIAIGNGTAGRETDEFVAEVLQTLERKPIKIMVNESGASVYSASEVAIAEFPDQDVTVRGAVSIGRRLQDPLAELVKIDPKSIGVGQYQHDVDQKLLKKKLDETVESCVNYVGVDLNMASKELLSYVSGISPTVANNIVQYRNQNGAFADRRQLLKVPKLGPKAFEQAAGFLRIRGGKNPLDNTAVHPESYSVVETIATDLNVPLTQITEIADRLKKTDLKKYVTEAIGEPTLRDILAELEKPGRDPRAEFKYATFKEGIKEINDLKPGMELEGVVTNVANFGAFVDIGVHQDGLVHVSQLADRFVSDPKQVVKVGQVVKVRVLEVNEQLKRISLSMRSPNADEPRGARGQRDQRDQKDQRVQQAQKGDRPQRQEPKQKEGKRSDGRRQEPKTQETRQSSTSLEDLKAKFNRKA